MSSFFIYNLPKTRVTQSNLLNSISWTELCISVSWKLFCYKITQINWTRVFEYNIKNVIKHHSLKIYSKVTMFSWSHVWHFQEIFYEFKKMNSVNLTVSCQLKKNSVFRSIYQTIWNIYQNILTPKYVS